MLVRCGARENEMDRGGRRYLLKKPSIEGKNYKYKHFNETFTARRHEVRVCGVRITFYQARPKVFLHLHTSFLQTYL